MGVYALHIIALCPTRHQSSLRALTYNQYPRFDLSNWQPETQQQNKD